MNEQLTLAPVHLHDGAESREAAAKVKAAAQYRLVLHALAKASQPLTDDTIARRCGLLRHSAGTRRGVAVKAGHVVKVGRGVSALGNAAATWSITAAGRRFLSELEAA